MYSIVITGSNSLQQICHSVIVPLPEGCIMQFYYRIIDGNNITRPDISTFNGLKSVHRL